MTNLLTAKFLDVKLKKCIAVSKDNYNSDVIIEKEALRERRSELWVFLKRL